MKTPEKSILNRIKQPDIQKSIPFHMPGHKRNVNFNKHLNKIGIRYDFTEIPQLDNLQAPEGIIKNVMNKAQLLWNTKKSFLSVNGSTCGINAAVATLADLKDNIIVARNSHKSVYNAIELLDLEPVFIAPAFNNKLNISGSILPETVYNAIFCNPDAKTVLLTSPTYDGVISDIKAICDISHKMNIPVIVDEAHGAHLHLSNCFGNSAISANADIVIQSLHKTLPGLTQTAIAHICTDRIDVNRFQRYLSVFQTSSPGYPLLSSIEGCIDLLLGKKDTLYSDWIKNIDYIDNRLANLKNIKAFYHGLSKNEVYGNIYAYDRSKLLLSTDNLSLNGKQLFDMLMKDYGIICEMYTNSYVLAMLSMCDKKSSIRKLCNALEEIDLTCSENDAPALKNTQTYDIPKRCMSIREARNKRSTGIPVSEAQGHICAEYIWAYPPGIPYLIPGEKITLEITDILKEAIDNGIALKTDNNNKQGYITVLCN